jgi:hypothetical protein
MLEGAGASCILMASFPPREYPHARCARRPSHYPNTAINRESRQTGRDAPHLFAIPALRHRAAIIIGCRAAPRPPCLLSAPGTTIFARFQHGSHECHRGRETSVLEFSRCMHSGKSNAARFVQYGDCIGTLLPRKERTPLHAARQWRREADAQPPMSYPTRHTSASPPV